MKKLNKEDYHTTDWSGGKTTELWIYPPESSYQKRDFKYRISSASVELDESDFTKLPGVKRKLMVLQGDIRIQHNHGDQIILPQYTEHSFMGDWDTKSYGRCVDYNLMLKDGTEGSITTLSNPGDYQYNAEQLFLYVYKGSITMCQHDKQHIINLKESESVFMKADSDTVVFTVKELSPQSICIVCELSLNQD